jgi:ABC-type transporter Mla subunit MlaD
MTQALADAAANLRAAADTVARVRTAIPRAALGPDAFGADATGRLGTLGAQLSQVWESALDDRVAEASAMVDRLNEVAHAIGLSAQRYADVEHATRHAWGEGSR